MIRRIKTLWQVACHIHSWRQGIMEQSSRRMHTWWGYINMNSKEKKIARFKELRSGLQFLHRCIFLNGNFFYCQYDAGIFIKIVTFLCPLVCGCEFWYFSYPLQPQTPIFGTFMRHIYVLCLFLWLSVDISISSTLFHN